MSHRIPLAAWLAALLMLALSMSHTPARPETARKAPPPVPADRTEDGLEARNCFDTLGDASRMASCQTIYRSARRSTHVIDVRPAMSEEERAAAEARDRRWVQRCRPTIRQDHYGMPRYIYAAPGCEYGRLD